METDKLTSREGRREATTPRRQNKKNYGSRNLHQRDGGKAALQRWPTIPTDLRSLLCRSSFALVPSRRPSMAKDFIFCFVFVADVSLYLLIKKVIEIAASLILLAIETVLKKALAIAAVIAGFVGTILILYYKWEIITNFIKNLF